MGHHDVQVMRMNQFKVGDTVLLDKSNPRLFPLELESSGSNLFTVLNVFPYGKVEVTHSEFGTFKEGRLRDERLMDDFHSMLQDVELFDLRGIGLGPFGLRLLEAPKNDLLKEMVLAKMHLNLEIDKAERYWEQRTRATWLQHGDRNTVFFHKPMKVFSGKGMFVGWRKDHLQFWRRWTEIGGGGSDFVIELWAQWMLARSNSLLAVLSTTSTMIVDR
ncbi:hypothetical protein GOBAR_DD14318 [Gossypium barbadense]|nr:hypothetical protein GOBAR_DD14318 [Gossypium barbadense]